MNKVKNLMYVSGFLLLLIGIIMIFISAFSLKENLRFSSYILITISIFTFLFAFFLDFKMIMIDKKTAGDKYTILTKVSLIKEIKKRNLKYIEDKSREYYLMILREDDEKNEK